MLLTNTKKSKRWRYYGLHGYMIYGADKSSSLIEAYKNNGYAIEYDGGKYIDKILIKLL